MRRLGSHPQFRDFGFIHKSKTAGPGPAASFHRPRYRCWRMASDARLELGTTLPVRRSLQTLADHSRPCRRSVRIDDYHGLGINFKSSPSESNRLLRQRFAEANLNAVSWPLDDGANQRPYSGKYPNRRGNWRQLGQQLCGRQFGERLFLIDPDVAREYARLGVAADEP